MSEVAARLSGDGAALMLDSYGTVLACTPGVVTLLGARGTELIGRPFADFLAAGASRGMLPRDGRATLRPSGGPAVRVRLKVLPLGGGLGAQCLVWAVPEAVAADQEQDQALVRALSGQTEIGLVLHDPDLRIVRSNHPPGALGPPADSGAGLPGATLDEVLVPQDAAAVEKQLRQVAQTGVPVTDQVLQARYRTAPEQERVISLSALRLEDRDGRSTGVAVLFRDVTERHQAQRRQALVEGAEKLLLGSLDIVATAEGLARVLVPEYGDLAAIDLAEAALLGEEPGDLSLAAPLRRAAVAGSWPAELLPVGALVRVRDPEREPVYQRHAVAVPDLTELRAALADDAEGSRQVLPDAATSLLMMPLRARGQLLGAAVLWRCGNRARFDQDDATLGAQVGARAAISLDNARRYTRERRTAEILQRSLLPQADVQVSAAEAAGTYVPAGTATGIGGTWFDVIPLSSCRVAFVVGDVLGHGVEAAAAMGRLRTAVQTLSDMDLPPEELLAHLDDLVTRLSQAERAASAPPAGHRVGSVLGSTCVYAVYDPVTGLCAIASAGHPPPVLSAPEQSACFAQVKPGPPLGVGGLPFESTELVMEPGTLLAFYTDKLLAHRQDGTEERLQQLRDQVQAAARKDRSAKQTGHVVLRHLLPQAPEQEVALLIARLYALPLGSVAAWEFPADPEAVSRARYAVTTQLAVWQMEELAFTTELLVSELVTNSIRYAGGPVGLRLIRDKTLICEISDPSQTQPRLRRALVTDEGGRGLFLVAQLAQRWGSRYTSHGKTIWAEQQLPVH
ncbi:SpoIIE family protein phosphatase [Streptomyces cyslabdanicus]|uniref:SpoIIE family protein phosphatase n=1 Tax=Streptomyces cyslabdanicus TaxID=1470456 RepID=UPI0040440C90